jgi:hypothetical protein
MNPQCLALLTFGAVAAACQISTDNSSALSSLYSPQDRRWIEAFDQIAGKRGYLARPDYEPKEAPYRTVMTYTKMMTERDSITFLLAQDRATKQYSVIIWDLPTTRWWTREARELRDSLVDQMGGNRVRLTKPWMEHYSSSHTMQPTSPRQESTFSLTSFLPPRSSLPPGSLN